MKLTSAMLAQNHFTIFNEEFTALLPRIEGDDPWRRKGRPENQDGIVRRAARLRPHCLDNDMVTRYELTRLRQRTEANLVAMAKAKTEELDILFNRIVELEEANKDLRFMLTEIMEEIGE